MVMRKRLIETVLATVLIGCWITDSAQGQRRASINRASGRSASTQIGRIGGDYTGRYGDPDFAFKPTPKDLKLEMSITYDKLPYKGKGWIYVPHVEGFPRAE